MRYPHPHSTRDMHNHAEMGELSTFYPHSCPRDIPKNRPFWLFHWTINRLIHLQVDLP